MSTPPRSVGDPLLEQERRQRLQRLDQRRRAATSARARRGPSEGRGTAPPVPRAKRRHPARSARLGALALSVVSAGGLASLLAKADRSQAATQSLAALPVPVPVTNAPAAVATVAATATTATPAVTPTAVTTATTAVAAPTTSAAPTLQAYNGDVIETQYGPVEVQVQLTQGSISEVAVVEYPGGDGRSVRINARALPILRSEVLSAQSAQIDTVSGATYTSGAYVRSLQSALDQARADGVTTPA